MKYCVYLTEYEGLVLPKKYIGSSNTKRIENGYKGSVSSKKWKDIWKKEIKNNPHLFKVTILSTHSTRSEALQEELRLQKHLNVVKDKDYINESLAQLNGYAGRDVNGMLNPMFGKGKEVTEWCRRHPEIVSARNKKAAHTQWSNPDSRASKILGMIGKKKTRKTLTEEEFRELQRKKSLISKVKRGLKIYYNNKVYLSWNDLKKETGLSKYVFTKHFLGEKGGVVEKNMHSR